MVCVLCEKNAVENWFGSFCSECRQIKNLGNVYGFKRTLEILKKCCIRDESQLERKIENHKNKLPTIKEETEELKSSKELYDSKPNTRSSKKK